MSEAQPEGSGTPASSDAPRILEFRDLRIEIDARRVFLHDEEVQLTRSEFDLLTMLASHPARVLSREQLFKRVWDTQWLGDGHAVEVQMSRLRLKLDDVHRERPFIATVRSAGYRFDGEPQTNIVTIEYDAQLRVTLVDPYDQTFFGWDPRDVIGTHFLLDVASAGRLTQDQAIRMLTLMALSGILETDTAYEVRCADGSTRVQRASIQLRVDGDGALAGMRLVVR